MHMKPELVKLDAAGVFSTPRGSNMTPQSPTYGGLQLPYRQYSLPKYGCRPGWITYF